MVPSCNISGEHFFKKLGYHIFHYLDESISNYRTTKGDSLGIPICRTCRRWVFWIYPGGVNWLWWLWVVDLESSETFIEDISINNMKAIKRFDFWLSSSIIFLDRISWKISLNWQWLYLVNSFWVCLIIEKSHWSWQWLCEDELQKLLRCC